MRAPVLLAALTFLGACTTPEQQLKATNNPPVADAGANITQTADRPVKIEGGGSFDPDGDAIQFGWAFDTIPTTSAIGEIPFPGEGSTAPQTQFNADVAGTYIVKLVVTDAKGSVSTPDYVVIRVTEGSSPVANAGPDQASTLDAGVVTLDGSGSHDPLGRDLSYSWEVESAPTVSGVTALVDGTTVAPTFTPDVGGRYVMSLTVENGFVGSEPDTMVVLVTGQDCPPEPVAGDDTAGEDCSQIPLDGSATYDCDPGDTLTYQWDVQTKPATSSATHANFDDRTSETPNFYADVAGTYVLSLTAYDGTHWGTPDTLTLTVSERSFNTPPTANAGSPKNLAVGTADCDESGYTYACDECAAFTADLGDDATVSDGDGDAMTYLWSVVDGDATIADPTSLVTTVELEGAEPTEPAACTDTTYTFQLLVTDCTGASTTSTVTYTANCCGIADTGSR
jgi:hypothetical protein